MTSNSIYFNIRNSIRDQHFQTLESRSASLSHSNAKEDLKNKKKKKKVFLINISAGKSVLIDSNSAAAQASSDL